MSSVACTPSVDQRNSARGCEYCDTLVVVEDEQILVAGDDQLSSSGNRAGQDVIIVGVATCWFKGVWHHVADQLAVVVEREFDRGLMMQKTHVQMWACEGGAELVKQYGRSEQCDVAGTGGHDEAIGHPAPQQRRDYNVGVEYNPHG